MTVDQLPEKLRKDANIRIYVPGEKVTIKLSEEKMQELENFYLPRLDKMESA